jgi:histidinol phosphatase-like enzyme (inositol monophosphatase family)
MTDLSLDRFFAELAEVSSQVILPFFRMTQGVVDKSLGPVFDPVTEADRAAEQAIRQKIRTAFPDHGIHGEEFGIENEGAQYQWIIDPIDGTRGFICGLPTWGTLVALLKDGMPVYGMMNQPYVRERFIGDGHTSRALTGAGERLLRTRPCNDISKAFISTTSPRIIKGAEGEAYDRLEAQCRLARYGADCYAYAMVAAGQIDIVVETGLQSYDIAPLIPIIEGAGGIVTTWTGESAASGGSIVAAGDKRLHAMALEILSGGQRG